METVYQIVRAILHRWPVDGSGGSGSGDMHVGGMRMSKVCIVCWDAARNTQLVPCRHEILCKWCAEQVMSPAKKKEKRDVCPLCQTRIEGVREHVAFGADTIRMSGAVAAPVRVARAASAREEGADGE